MSEDTGVGMLCECCGSDDVHLDLVRSKFEYNDGGNIVELDVDLPVYTCYSCDFEYTAQEAEQIKHEAICRYHKILAPAQIVGIRKEYKLTKRDLAELTGIGYASICRWESGTLLQSKSNDKFLRLMRYEEVVQRLHSIGACEEDVLNESDEPVFAYLKCAEQYESRSQNFFL